MLTLVGTSQEVLIYKRICHLVELGLKFKEKGDINNTKQRIKIKSFKNF